MRPIARQSARLASTSTQRIRASSPRSPYYASATSQTQAQQHQQRRAFHATPSSLAESRPPHGSPEHQRALEERRAADEALRQQHQQQQDQHGLENGAEARRPGAGRRSLRQRRVADVPPPPPVPEWFLRQNVVLVKEDEGGGDGGARMVRCVDSKTGHTLFTVPFYPGEAQEEKAKVDAEEAARKAQEEQAKQASIPGISMLGDNFFQQKFGGQIPPVLESKEDLPLGFKFPQAADLQASKDPLAWTLLETEASVRAAMGASAQTGAAASSHAASRSDIHLHCPDSNAHVQMDQYVRDLARILHADLITLDANDIADLTSDYVGGGSDLPGSFGTLAYDVYDGAVANGLAIRGGGVGEQHEAEEEDEEDGEDEAVTPQDSMNLGHFGSFDELRKALGDKRHDINKALGNFGMAGVSVGLPQGVNPFAPPARQEPAQSKKPDPADYVTWDDARLLALLDGLLDAPSAAKAANLGQGSQEASTHLEDADDKKETPWAVRAGSMVAGVASKIEFAKSAASTDGKSDNVPLMKLDMVDRENAKPDLISQDGRKTIVQVRDLKQILGHKLGESIIKRLVRVVQKRRRAGEEIVIIGTTAEEVTGPLDSLFDINEDSPFRMIVVPPLFDMSAAEQASFEASALPPPYRSIHDAPSYDRIASVNLRHVSSMMRRLGHDLDSRTMEESFRELKMPGTHILSEKILPQGEMQRLVLTAIGLSKSHANSDSVTPIHIALATAILSKADHAVHSWTSFQEAQQRKNNPFTRAAASAGGAGATAEKTPGQARIEGIKKNCNQHETRLLAGVVDPANIKTGFNDVHASPDSIEALKSMTTLSLQRPDAFEYGVLANDRLTGLLLYGPPGTGKTLLAKAVAKESGATVLEVSGAQIYEKYVGEGEKMVRAVFSLAKKISPCVVFIDEADAIFGSRGGSGNRNTHREIINQFLREWDGMDDNSVFMMVASNRPFDLDDAVLRRLPRRLLVDLPVAKDRESILGIHLRHEALDSSVDLAALSEQTPLYSGSDLKNLCVSAALAAVREENELAAQHKDDKDFKLPEKRTLAARHFDKAVAEISASINEDMSSLTAIRKFDEQFGDRRGRKKKSAYGFGVGDEGVDENSARVRQGP